MFKALEVIMIIIIVGYVLRPVYFPILADVYNLLEENKINPKRLFILSTICVIVLHGILVVILVL